MKASTVLGLSCTLFLSAGAQLIVGFSPETGAALVEAVERALEG